ncbi:MAG TPA: hypothetical protein GX011_04515 [Clostridiales bacterium]|nr:hypothetical protein [Clostridiales bacterium]
MKSTYKDQKRRRIVEHLDRISRHSIRLLHICLPLITAVLIGITIMFRDAIRECPASALYKYPEVFEYIMISLVVAVAGAVILDISEKRDS